MLGPPRYSWRSIRDGMSECLGDGDQEGGEGCTSSAYADVGGFDLGLGGQRCAQLGSLRTGASYLHLAFPAGWDIDFLEPNVFLPMEPQGLHLGS